ncbi:conotoxin [Echinococcus multilocularis]|uniref:Thionin n=1 Tax=Echinococcus multilocularis TaxID=6211 RepID=A0A068YDI6_ECHMU|nr:conotoxin [Echinococcus multilocularis]
MNEATVCFVLLTSLVCLAKTQSRGYQRILGASALRKYCSEDGEECMFSTHCCPGLYCALQGNIGICLTQESVLTKCLSDADCPETKCCHRQRRRGGFGTCAYVCDDNEILMDMPSNLPVGSYRGDDFWNYWLHKRHFTTPQQRYLHRKW